MGYLNLYNSVLNAYYSSMPRQHMCRMLALFPVPPTDFKHLDTEVTQQDTDASGPAPCHCHGAPVRRLHWSITPPRSCLGLLARPPASNSHVFHVMSGITVTLATKPALVSKPHLLHHKFK